ncbi:hypothetical protein MalM25_20700 [Planctomycetes bacterium MalM25]|nr:hypothetical protein MalM25_20700 [Planctomycetes bacterium MalM25]
MKTRQATADRDATLAKTLAPEDVRPGDYVAVLDEEYECCAAAWYCDPPPHADKVIHVRLRPREPEPPLRVIDACLPFVYVQPPKGDGRTLDLRAVRLARLDRDYARRVCKLLQPKKKRKRRK